MIRNWLQILDQQHKNQDEPTSGLDQDLAYSPIHYLFEIQLMTNQICGKPTAENSADFAWVVKQQHVKRYLLNYYRKHSTLPAGRCYLRLVAYAFFPPKYATWQMFCIPATLRLTVSINRGKPQKQQQENPQ